MKDVAAREGRRAFVGGIGVEADPAAHRGEARGVVVTRVVHVGDGDGGHVGPGQGSGGEARR